ncbi:MAG: hypothetical protein WCH85_07145 [Methanomicrobiales archaeon]
MDDARSWYLSGMKIPVQNRSQKALLAFEQSHALDPGNAGAWNVKGVALAHLFEKAEASRHLIVPSNGNILQK